MDSSCINCDLELDHTRKRATFGLFIFLDDLGKSVVFLRPVKKENFEKATTEWIRFSRPFHKLESSPKKAPRVLFR